MRQPISREEAYRLFQPRRSAREPTIWMHPKVLAEIEEYLSGPAQYFIAGKAPYTGPDLFDVAPPGVHALLAFRNVHRFTGVLDGTTLAVQE